MKLGPYFKIHKNQLQVCYKWKQNNKLVEDYMEEYLCDLKEGTDLRHLKALIIK